MENIGMNYLLSLATTIVILQSEINIQYNEYVIKMPLPSWLTISIPFILPSFGAFRKLCFVWHFLCIFTYFLRMPSSGKGSVMPGSLYKQNLHRYCICYIWVGHMMSYKAACAPSENYVLTRIVTGHSLGSQGSKVSSGGQRRLWYVLTGHTRNLAGNAVSFKVIDTPEIKHITNGAWEDVFVLNLSALQTKTGFLRK